MQLSSPVYASLLLLLAGCTPSAVDPPMTSSSTTSGSTSATTVGPTGGGTLTGGATDTTASDPTAADPTDDAGDTALNCAQNFVFECDVPKPECDVWAQDCGPGEKCSAYAQPASERWKWSTRCVPVVPDPAPVGEPCEIEAEMFAHGEGYSGVDDCDASAICWDLVERHNNSGECLPRCTGSDDAPVCAQGNYCAPVDTASEDGDGSVLNLCVELCDPLLGDCPADQLCKGHVPGFTCLPDTSRDSLPVHAACDSHDACAPGLFCADVALSSGCDPEGEQCCLAFCDTTIDPNPACGVGESCTTLWVQLPPPAGLEHLGFCNSGG